MLPTIKHTASRLTLVVLSLLVGALGLTPLLPTAHATGVACEFYNYGTSASNTTYTNIGDSSTGTFDLTLRPTAAGAMYAEISAPVGSVITFTSIKTATSDATLPSNQYASTTVTGSKITLVKASGWAYNINTNFNYRIHYSLSGFTSSPGEEITAKLSDSTAGTDATDCSGTGKVKTNTVGSSAPSAPTLSGTAGNQSAIMSWSSIAGATGYVLKKDGSTVYTGTNTMYTVTGLANGTSYSFNVYSTNASGTSTASNTVAITPPLPPSAPTLSGSAGNTTVNLTWNVPSGATSYKVYRNGQQVYSGTATSFTDVGLTNGLKYKYKVTAGNVSGDSSVSNELSLTPLTPGGDIQPRDIELISMAAAGYIAVKFIGLFRYKGLD